MRNTPPVTSAEESTISLLKSVPLFAELDQDELERFSRVAIPRSYPEGTRVFHEGDHSDACYIVKSGTFRVTREHPDGRAITLGEHHQLQRGHRTCAQDPDFQAIYRQHRPMVERSIAWLTRGARRVPYRGVAKNDAWLHHRAAGLNLRRLLALGLTHQRGTWTIA